MDRKEWTWKAAERQALTDTALVHTHLKNQLNLSELEASLRAEL
jgi:hypothetical protein